MFCDIDRGSQGTVKNTQARLAKTRLTRTTQIKICSFFSSATPGPPYALTVLEVTKRHVELKWEAPKSNGGRPITKYVYVKVTVDESIKVLISIRVTVRDNVQAMNVSSGLALNNISVFAQKIRIV